jgi:homoserine kinase
MFTVRVPATIANMGPGFDSFGMAVNLANRFAFELAAPGQPDQLTFTAQDESELSALCGEKASDNILLQAMNQLFLQAGQARPPLRIQVEANIPVTRGLGSSSTAIVAGLFAANRLLENRFTDLDLLEIAISMEGHPDNVAPALLGGVVLYDDGIPYRLPWPDEWRIMTLSPAYPIRTDEARRLLPTQAPLSDAVFNLRKASVLTYALLQSDAEALRHSLQDRLHQPYRRQLLAEYEALERAVMQAGAYGMIISGSGSTMAVFYPAVLHHTLLETVQNLMTDQGWNFMVNTLAIDRDGARFE